MCGLSSWKTNPAPWPKRTMRRLAESRSITAFARKTISTGAPIEHTNTCPGRDETAGQADVLNPAAKHLRALRDQDLGIAFNGKAFMTPTLRSHCIRLATVLRAEVQWVLTMLVHASSSIAPLSFQKRKGPPNRLSTVLPHVLSCLCNSDGHHFLCRVSQMARRE
ncbi:hypothetical protein BDD14_6610 [Edaphobacter modestus]|uniref:Uncharacterized protein n=1 Tax=Edaphobacter modestus TaxID=388466 RepID=A0A4Q7XY40_9BACT|nr:hypothetical protein BDD14_6610 [Edaphobacter modestus]